MSLGGFTLADRLGAKTVPCRVKGCTRTWMQLGSKVLALGNAPDANDPTASMCEPCRTKAKELKDQDRRCEREGCTGTWPWSADKQLEAFATKRPAPRGLCAECETRLAGLTEQEVPCTAAGCTRTATLTPRAQLMGGTGDALCVPCADVLPRIKDRQVSCGIANCKRKWTWKVEEQVQAFTAGKPNEPPRRMCDECRTEFGKLLDREVRCRTSGCKKTWTWSRFDQLDACVAGKPAPKAPQRMCESCFGVFQNAKDVERPCRKSGCKGTWLDKRGAQLARAVRGKTGDPYPRYCPEHEKDLGDLQDREITCRTDGCDGTWTWSKEQQLAAGVRPQIQDEPAAEAAPPAAEGTETVPAEAAAPEAKEEKKEKRGKRRREPKPPERRCSACAEFLQDKKTQEIPCSQCATPIYWPPESMLQTHLGNWAAPSLCGACKRDATEAARKAAKEALREQFDAQAQAAAVPAPETPPSSEG